MCNTIDPLAGSYYVESLTSEIEKRVKAYLQKIDELGGMVGRLHQLPVAWQRLAERVEFRRADTSDELRRLAADVFLLNLDGLRRKLWAR